MPPIPEDAVIQAFLRLYDNLKHGEILQFIQKTLSTIRSRKMLWSTDIVGLNQRISDIKALQLRSPLGESSRHAPNQSGSSILFFFVNCQILQVDYDSSVTF